MELSIVIPIKNEGGSILSLAGEINAGLAALSLPWEVIWVDDHSTDGSRAILGDLSAMRPQHRVIDLSGATGQSAALVAGFQVAQGHLLATLDGDGQNDPADLPRLIEHLKATSADMVNGIRVDRKDRFNRRIVSSLGNWFRNYMTEEETTDVGCAIRVFTRACVADTSMQPRMYGWHRFMPSIARLNGRRRIEELPVAHRDRTAGKSKYTISGRTPELVYDAFMMAWALRSAPKRGLKGLCPLTERRQRLA